MSVSDVACSYGTRATGSVSVAVSNPGDGAGTATYSVAVGTRSAATGAVADGGGGSVRINGVAGGPHTGSVAGSDGTSAVFPVEVPTCPRYEGVRVGVHKLADHRLRVRLDNTRNAHATRFRIVVGGAASRHGVGAADVSTVRKPLHRVTRVRVYVGQHLVARARLRP